MIQKKRWMALLLVAVLGIAFTGCNKTEYTDSDRVIEASELKAMMDDQNLFIIDARSPEDYAKGHLAGAVCISAKALTMENPAPAMIADNERVDNVLSEAGLSKSSKVVIYDNAGGVYASRVWWTLKVYGHKDVKVVNGGQKAIESAFDRSDFTTEPTELTATDYKTEELDDASLATMDDVKQAIDNPDITIIDVRSAAEYDEGAIPSAVLYPHTKNYYADGTMKSPRDIYLDYKDLGVEREDELILYCKSSFRATVTKLLLMEAGYENVKIYDGAWLEWQMGDAPVEEKEEETVPTTQDAS